jgi:hypothetical protein
LASAGYESQPLPRPATRPEASGHHPRHRRGHGDPDRRGIIAPTLLAFTGVLLAGGWLPLWVCWRSAWSSLRADGVAAHLLANLLERQRWLAWAGLLIVLYVAAHMIWQGVWQVSGAVAP